MNPCPFCDIPPKDILLEDGPCVAIHDRYPVSRGHCLIIPRRHVKSVREFTSEEWAVILSMTQELARRLQQEDPSIEGFNLGVNDGDVAGQTIFHVHVHWIPRRKGDVKHPAGGVRWLFPEKANYLASSGPQSVIEDQR